MNIGKVFEGQVKKSTPDYILLHRLADDTTHFGDSKRLRFSKKNPFDFIMWHPRKQRLWALELKTVAGKSISFDRTKDDKKTIHLHQIEGLSKWDKFDGTVCGFLIEFREIEKTIFIRIKDFLKMMDINKKVSFTIEDLKKWSIPYFTVPQRKLKTKYMYDIEKLLNENI